MPMRQIRGSYDKKTYRYDKNVNEATSDGVIIDDEIEGVGGGQTVEYPSAAESGEHGNRDGRSAAGTHRRRLHHAWRS